MCDGVVLCFFSYGPYADMAPHMLQALDTYLGFIGPDTLRWYANTNGDFQPLTRADWASTREELVASTGCNVTLVESEMHVGGYSFRCAGRNPDPLKSIGAPENMSAVDFWLPTEYLEEHGPGRVRELALSLARELPFCSGYVTLAIEALYDIINVRETVSKLCADYPGLEMHDMDSIQLTIGTLTRGPFWMNFYGQPLLGKLGDADGLRTQLPLPGITVEEVATDKVLVTVGEWPEAGGPGSDMSLYRALARVLEPFLCNDNLFARDTRPPEMRRWLRRFLD